MYKNISYNESFSDMVSDLQLPIHFPSENKIDTGRNHRVLSLFSGCGGMDIGFEGAFIAPRKSFPVNSSYIERKINDEWILLRRTSFRTVFANDILQEAQRAWLNYMYRFGYDPSIYRRESIVDLVKMQLNGTEVFPHDIDVVTGGFPCQDFSVAGKRGGFNSHRDDKGKLRSASRPTEESRGRLYYWMKQVIDITQPKIFIAENVRGLVNLGNVKDVIQHDFASAGGNGYIVLPPRLLNAGDYGVPETRERVIFVGIRRDAMLPEALKALEMDHIPNEYDPYPKRTHAYTSNDPNLLKPVCTTDVLGYLKEPEETKDLSQTVYSKAKFLSNRSQGQTEISLDGLGPTIRSEHHGNIEYRRLSIEHGGKYKEELRMGMKERRLTPRECALIQTFPPDYEFVIKNNNNNGYYISPSGAYKIIGNAVPPVLAYKIATRLEEVWGKYFG